MSELVLIRLTRRNRLTEPGEHFVQCDQLDCQYVETNAPPCPLHVGMFAEEIRAAAAAREARHESY